MEVKGVIFDWAGTTVDFGCMAPVNAIENAFEKSGIKISPTDARKHMGMKKYDHIKSIFNLPNIAFEWKNIYGCSASEKDISNLYLSMEEILLSNLSNYSVPVPGILDIVDKLRRLNIAIGSTTGYTKNMMKIVAEESAKYGYVPDVIISSDEVPVGRPAPFMCYENANRLNLYPMNKLVKIGDTVVDIEEGKNAGMWSVAVINSSSEMGLSYHSVRTMDEIELRRKASDIYNKFKKAGADYIIFDISELEDVIYDISIRLSNKNKFYKSNSSFSGEGDVNDSINRKLWKESLSEEIRLELKRDKEYFLGQSLSSPCLSVLSDCYDSYLTDISGKRYLDFHGNSVHQIGFRNKAVLDAVTKQMNILPFCTRRYTNSKIVDLAEKLISLTSGNLDKVLFAPAATLAVSSAMKLVRGVTGKHKFISCWGSFHGASLDAVSLGGETTFRKNAGPLIPGVEHIFPVDSYRCKFGECSSCNLECLDDLERVLEFEGDIGGVILEPISNTDVHIPTDRYFTKLRDLCDKYSAMLIFDETPTALGRTGKMFAYQNYNIVPDIVILGKGLGGGIIPFAAMLTKKEFDIVQNMSIGHYTHEKNPLGAAAGLAVINEIEKNDLLNKSVNDGNYIMSKFKHLKDSYNIVGDVRGIGLLFALELVTDRDSKIRAVTEAENIMYMCLDKGLSFKVTSGSTLNLIPPLTIKRGDLDRAYEVIEETIDRITMEGVL